jgi:hypothetical protein
LVPFTDLVRSSTYQLASFKKYDTEDEDQQPPRPLATPPPHAYRAGIIGTGVAAIGDDKTIARVTKIENRDSINIIACVRENEDCDSINTIACVRKNEDRDSVAIVSIGDSANKKINARVRDIEDCNSVANVIVDEACISSHQQTNVAIVIYDESNFSSR